MAARLSGGWRRRVPAGPRRRFWQHQKRPKWCRFIPALTRRILLEARKLHSRQDYTRMAEPILFEIQQRGHEILEYLSRQTPTAASNISNLIP
jgi:hypothetical protein